ncbi:NAD-dependent epimerase/dehydratase family protein [Streptomyces lavendofoliae]|uniref:NAD-dependent epimerase/dehydratase family protein n=1 Tax=Streptomyces lavendofoliae TaxID=67314 RepID=UPI003D8E452C
MKVLVLGGDGYLGWPSALHLSRCGHQVGIVDNFARRGYDDELGIASLVPLASLGTRVAAWQEVTGLPLDVYEGDLTEAGFIHRVVRQFRPEAVVHFAEQRAAPYSMIDREHAVYTQVNNVVGTLNLLYAIGELDRDIHLVKLGTMGEYGTPNIDIEEGWLEVEHKGRTDRVLYPKRPGSFYHLSKVHDSHNIEFACRAWGLRATDLNQGIVYGQQTPDTALDARLATRFDYDSLFGTVVNRFVVQAVLGLPLTVYGGGGQTRGLIDIRDTVECIRLSVENPARAGEFRVFNQMTQSMSVLDIARTVAEAYPGEVDIEFLANPRVEADQHYYRVQHSRLTELGLVPHLLSETLLTSLFDIAREHAGRALADTVLPQTDWRAPSAAARTTPPPVGPILPQARTVRQGRLTQDTSTAAGRGAP